MNEYGKLLKVAVRRPEAAFVSHEKLLKEWLPLNYHSCPDLKAAIHEYRTFEKFLETAGCEVIALPSHENLTIDAIYVRDSLIITPRGLVRPRMGKPQRRNESVVNGQFLGDAGLAIIGEIAGSGMIEGGDLVWLDEKTLLAGIGYRTNAQGTDQLQKILGEEVTVHGFDLPHFKGPGDVFHLMSVLSPVDMDLAVVYVPLMPVRLVQFLAARGVAFVEVPEAEFESMGCNILAIAPRNVVMVDGNPETARRLKTAGVKVHIYKGDEISRKGEGGPTCLTRPLAREN